MYSIIVKDRMMIAHSLPDDFFGPAKELHGATYEVEIKISSKSLTAQSVVMDIGEAHRVLRETLAPMQYKNLDTLPQFSNHLTTTEFLAKYIHEQIIALLDASLSIGVTLHESSQASASYEA